MLTIMHRKNLRGFTLVEMMLVLVIISAIVMMSMNYYQQKTLQNQIDKSALDMQQILTAGMTFYAAKGIWPNDIACLTGNNFAINATVSCNIPLLPNAPHSPWLIGTGLIPYQVSPGNAGDPKFYVFINLTLPARGTPPTTQNGFYAAMIAGKMPLGYATTDAVPPVVTAPMGPPTPCTAASVSCTAVASVMPPGQSLNNAGNVNFAGTYRHGGCIPAPQCPTDPSRNEPLTPQVFVVPVSITGYYDATAGSAVNAYPITSFTAFAYGATATAGALPAANPAHCPTVTAPQTCPAGGSYWRACVDIQTQQGSVMNGATDWGNKVAVAAFTRCQPYGESIGGGLGIYEH